jgi:hypothetical protein
VLKIANSAPIQFLPAQRVSLTQSPDWPHDLALCFSPEEVIDLCQKIIGTRRFTVAPDVLEHLYIMTNGHPGLTVCLLEGLFDRPVSKEYYHSFVY